MLKILVLALFLCVTLAAAQPWTPHVPMAWDSDVVSSISIAPEIEVIGHYWNDGDHSRARIDANAHGNKITELITNYTMNIITMSDGQPTCESQYGLVVSYNQFWWVQGAPYSGFDSTLGCYKWTYTYPDFFSLFGVSGNAVACFSSPQVPVYTNSTVFTKDESLTTNIVFRNFVARPQNPSLFTIPGFCPPPSWPGADVARAQNQKTMAVKDLPSAARFLGIPQIFITPISHKNRK